MRNNAVAPAVIAGDAINTTAPVEPKKSSNMVGAVVNRLRRPSSAAARNSSDNGGTVESKVVQVAPHIS